MTYVGAVGGEYYWISPPYVAGATTMNPDYGMTPVSASAGIGLQDDHGHPGFAKPYKYNTVSSDQMYQFQCPYYNSNQWVQMWPLVGTLPITRVVNYTNGNQIWYYEITKSGMTAAGNLP